MAQHLGAAGTAPSASRRRRRQPTGAHAAACRRARARRRRGLVHRHALSLWLRRGHRTIGCGRGETALGSRRQRQGLAVAVTIGLAAEGLPITLLAPSGPHFLERMIRGGRNPRRIVHDELSSAANPGRSSVIPTRRRSAVRSALTSGSSCAGRGSMDGCAKTCPRPSARLGAMSWASPGLGWSLRSPTASGRF